MRPAGKRSEGRSWFHNSGLRLGFFVGLVFGALNLLFSWLLPLSDDSIGALGRSPAGLFARSLP